jgi:hypothetical protein
MALKPCRECGAQVSDAANICPSCGIQSPARKPDPARNTSVGCVGALGIAAVILIVLAVIGTLATPDRPAAPDPCDATAEKRQAAATMIRLTGYDCKTVGKMCPYIFSEGYTVYCNNLRYVYEIENHGGKWSVTSH